MIQNNPCVSGNIWGNGWNTPYAHNTPYTHNAGTQTPNMWGTPWMNNMHMNPNIGTQFTTNFGTNMPNVWGTPWMNNMHTNPNFNCGSWIPTTIGTTQPWNIACNNPWTWPGQNTINTPYNPYNTIHGISTYMQQVPINTMNPGLTPWMTTQNNTPWGMYPYGCR